jgi:hypothetical protein
VRRHVRAVVHGGWRWCTAAGCSAKRRWRQPGIWLELGDGGQGPCASGRGAGLRPRLSGGLGRPIGQGPGEAGGPGWFQKEKELISGKEILGKPFY